MRREQRQVIGREEPGIVAIVVDGWHEIGDR